MKSSQAGTGPESPSAQTTNKDSQKIAGAASAPAKQSLRKNFSWTLVGNVVYAVCQMGILAIIARLGGAEMVGQFALGLAITAPVLMCANLNLRSIQATDANREFTFKQYLGLRLLTTLAALVVIAGIILFSKYPASTMTIIFVVALMKCVEALSDVYFGLFQQHEDMNKVATSMMAKGVLSLLVLAPVLFLSHNLAVSSLALCGVWALILVGYDMRNGRRLLERDPEVSGVRQGSVEPASRWPGGAFARGPLMKLAWLAAPMGLVMSLISLNTNIPRYFIEHQLGLRELGIFAAISYLVTAGSTIVMALGQSASPRLSQYYAREQTGDFLKLLAKLFGITAVISVGGWLVALVAGGPILHLLYGPDFAGRSSLFALVMAVAGIGFIGSVIGYAMTSARCLRVQAPLYLCSLLATLAGCWLLIRPYGMTGAVLALGAGSLAQLLGGSVVVLQAIRRVSGGLRAEELSEGRAGGVA